MTKFMSKKFSVGGYTKAYADNYDSVFRLKDETRFCLRCQRTYRIPREPGVPFGTPCPDCLEEMSHGK